MGAKRIGQRIHVYWTDETAWFSGIVQQFDATQGYYVVYDDGDERWESLTESYRFEGQQESDNDEEEEEDGAESDQENGKEIDGPSGVLQGAGDARLGRTPRATEPPGSEDDDDEEDGDEEDAEMQRPKLSSRSTGYPAPIVLDEAEDTTSEADGDDAERDNRDKDTGDDDEEEDSQSVAMTEVPITYAPHTNSATPVRLIRHHPRSLPHRGVLRGIIVRASELPHVAGHNTEVPSAFVRVAFVEGGASATGGRLQPSALLMRCKQALSVTRPAPQTTHPTWNEDEYESAEIWTDAADHWDGLFQLQVSPPLLVSAGERQPAWLQLKGDLLFSVYHQHHDVENGNTESKRNEFIGQATLPLNFLMRDVMASHATGPVSSITQCLGLETRQGKPLFGVTQRETAELVVRFQFEALFTPAIRRQKLAASAIGEELRQPTATARAPVSKSSGGGSSSRGSTCPPSDRAARPKSAKSVAGGSTHDGAKHQSSSAINRRRFEKQLELENKAMAKRVTQQRRESGAVAARRQQLNHQPPLKSEAKAPGVMAVAVAPSAVRRSHKASSQINRSKFHEQLKKENKAMGKRLVERVGVKDTEKLQSNERFDWDDVKTQDKAYVADKRHMWLQEKDYLLEKAQAKYQQQNELVEQVMALQEQVGEWKTKLFSVKSSLQHVEAMNKKDTHVRDCLRSAVERDAKRGGRSTAIAATTSAMHLEHVLNNDDHDDHDDEEASGSGDSAIQKFRRELCELLQETATLDTEKQRLESQLNDAVNQETTLEDEILQLHRKLQFVATKRAFRAKMQSDRATPASAAYAAQELKSKRHMMELSREEEEHYKIYRAQEQLTQLQIAVTVMRERLEKGTALRAPPATSSSAATCAYLREKITKRTTKLDQLESQQQSIRKQYEGLVVNGEYDRLRAQAQELQHLLFLCQHEAKHVAAAERVANHSKDKLTGELQKLRFQDQTETDILLQTKTNRTNTSK